MTQTNILTILIKLAKQGDADQQVVKGLAQLKAGIGTVMTAFAAFAGAAYAVDKALDATVGTFVNYAAQVREMNRLTGAGAEETSRLIQMADDLTISYESLQKSLWFASKNGVDVSVDSLASLADQYVALNSPMQQAQFLAEKFGKSGAEMAKMLEQGGDAVRDWANSIGGSLVLTDEAIQNAREYELALDELNDQWTAMKVGIGQAAVPALNDALFVMNNFTEVQKEKNRLLMEGTSLTTGEIDALAIANVKMNQYTDGLDSAGVSYRAWAQSIAESNEQLAPQVETIEQINQRNTDMLSVIMNLQSENDSYNESLASLNEKMASLTAEQSNYLAGSEEYNQLQGEIEETGGAIEDLAAAHEDAGKRIAFSMVQAKMAMDGFTDAEFDTLLALGEQWGILDHATVTAAQNMIREVDKLAGSTANALFTADQLRARWDGLLKLSGREIDLIVNMVVRQNKQIMPGGGASPAALATPMAEGGQLGEGWAIVGERGFEVVSPSGYVFPHEQAKQLIASGLTPEKALIAGGPLGTSSYLIDEDVRQYTYAPAAKPKKKRERGELSGGGGGGESAAASAVASAVVSEAVSPLVESNLIASQSTQAAQQANALEMRATREAITTGNTLMQQLNDNILRMNATNQDTIISALEQNRG